jgi:hypothetical protein
MAYRKYEKYEIQFVPPENCKNNFSKEREIHRSLRDGG